MDLWTETLEAKEYDALATMIANGVATEVVITTEQQPQSVGAGSPSEGGGGDSATEAGGRTLGVTRYSMDIYIYMEHTGT